MRSAAIAAPAQFRRTVTFYSSLMILAAIDASDRQGRGHGRCRVAGYDGMSWSRLQQRDRPNHAELCSTRRSFFCAISLPSCGQLGERVRPDMPWADRALIALPLGLIPKSRHCAHPPELDIPVPRTLWLGGSGGAGVLGAGGSEQVRAQGAQVNTG